MLIYAIIIEMKMNLFNAISIPKSSKNDIFK